MSLLHLTAETGTISVPLREWSRLRGQLRERWNYLVDADLVLLRELQARAMADSRGLRHLDRRDLVLDCYRAQGRPLLVVPEAAIIPLLLEPLGDGDQRFRAIRPGEFPYATQRTREFPVTPLARITLAEPPLHDIHWIVEEGEQAVERARDSPMGRIFFHLLEHHVNWGRSGHRHFDYRERWAPAPAGLPPAASPASNLRQP